MPTSKLQTQLLYPDLEAALETGDNEALHEICETLAAEDLAEMILQLSPENLIIFFEQIKEENATKIFELLDVDVQKTILNSVSNQRVAAIVNEMDPDDRTELLESLPQSVTRQLLSFLKPR